MSKFSDDDLFEDVGSVTGTYVKWNEGVGQKVQGVIVSYSVDGGTDFNGNAVPQIVIGTEDGNVIVNGSQANLGRNLRDGAAKLGVGRICRITWSGTFETPKGEGKEFTVQARDAKPGEVEALTGAPAAVATDDDF
jgi:hypothetical protein